MTATGPSSRWRGAIALLGILAVGLGIGCGVVAAGVSYERVRAICDRHAVDGSADFLTVARFAQARLMLAGCAAAGVLAGLALVLLSRPLARWAGQEASRWRQDGRRVLRNWRRRYARPRLVAWLAAILVLGLVCRLPGLIGTAPRGDESFTYVHYASQPLFIVLSLYDQPNNHVLHTVLVHLSTTVFGGAIWAVRLPAFLVGLLLIPLTFVWGRRCAGTTVGLLAAALVAVATPLVEYSTNARGYTLVCLFSLVMFLTARAALRGRNRVVALGFVASAGLGLYTVPTMAFPFLGCLLWLIVTEFAAWRRLALLVALAGIWAAVCYLPILATVGPKGLLGNEYVAPLTLGDWVAAGGHLAQETVRFWYGGRWWVAVVALVLAVAGGCRLARRRLGLATGIALFVVLVGLAVVMRRWPPPRVCIHLVPFLAVWVAAGLSLLPRRSSWLAGAILVGAQAWLLFAGDLRLADRETGTLPAGTAICDWLEPRFGETDRLLLQGPADGSMLYHLYRRGLPNAWLLRPPETAERLWILVNEEGGQTLASVLAVNQLSLRPGASLPREVARCGGAVILETVMDALERLPPSPGKTPA